MNEPVRQSRGQGSNELIRLVVVDDHTIIRQALRMLLESTGKIAIVADTPNGREAVRAAEQHRPDVVLMDISMPGLNGLDATRQIRRSLPRTYVIILSGFVDEDQLRESIRAGASGYLLKNADPGELLLAIQTVHGGNRYFSDDINTNFDVASVAYAASQRDPGHDERKALSPREREVLQLVAEGHTNQGIANELFLSVKTVESHKAKIMSKLGVRNRADLILFAVNSGLIRLDENDPSRGRGERA